MAASTFRHVGTFFILLTVVQLATCYKTALLGGAGYTPRLGTMAVYDKWMYSISDTLIRQFDPETSQCISMSIKGYTSNIITATSITIGGTPYLVAAEPGKLHVFPILAGGIIDTANAMEFPYSGSCLELAAQGTTIYGACQNKGIVFFEMADIAMGTVDSSGSYVGYSDIGSITVDESTNKIYFISEYSTNTPGVGLLSSKTTGVTYFNDVNRLKRIVACNGYVFAIGDNTFFGGLATSLTSRVITNPGNMLDVTCQHGDTPGVAYGIGPTLPVFDGGIAETVTNAADEIIAVSDVIYTLEKSPGRCSIYGRITPVPTAIPTAVPTAVPTAIPTAVPTAVPTAIPTAVPTVVPTTVPTAIPTAVPTVVPTTVPTVIPTAIPTAVPTTVPTAVPTTVPTARPIGTTAVPTAMPTAVPTAVPTSVPTAIPTAVSTAAPTVVPTAVPTARPIVTTAVPTAVPTTIPTAVPTAVPTSVPVIPTAVPTAVPTLPPTSIPTLIPTPMPSPLLPTPVPSTSVPETAAPPTEVPPVIDKKTAETVEGVGSAAAAASALGAGASAGPALRLVAISGSCRAGNENNSSREYPRPLHPTQWKIGDSYALGMVAGNVMISFGFAVLCFFILKIAERGGTSCAPKLFNGLDTQGLLRFPSAPLFVFQFLYQGTTQGGMSLVSYPNTPFHFIIGFVTCCGCAAVPIVIFIECRRGVPSQAVYADDARYGLKRLLMGPGEWVSNHVELHWVNRYRTVIGSFRQEVVWFSIVEFASMLAISAMESLNTRTLIQCGHKKLFEGFLFLILLVLEAILWPHCRARDSTVDFVLLGLQAAALFCMAAGFYEENTGHYIFEVASTFLFASVIILIVKSGIDVLVEGYILCKGIRTRVQQRHWAKNKKLDETSVVSESMPMRSSLGLSMSDALSPLPSMHPLASFSRTSNSGSVLTMRNLPTEEASSELSLMKQEFLDKKRNSEIFEI